MWNVERKNDTLSLLVKHTQKDGYSSQTPPRGYEALFGACEFLVPDTRLYLAENKQPSVTLLPPLCLLHPQPFRTPHLQKPD